MEDSTEEWTLSSEWNPLWRMAHVSVSIGRYLVLINGYYIRWIVPTLHTPLDSINPLEVIWDPNAPFLQLKTVIFNHTGIAIFDVVTGEWRVITCRVDVDSCMRLGLTESRLFTSGSAGSQVGSSVYMFGGFCHTEQQRVASMSMLDLSQLEGDQEEEAVWSLVNGEGGPNMIPSPRDKASMVTWEGVLVVFGGYGIDNRKPPGIAGWPYLDSAGSWLLHDSNQGWSNQVLLYHPPEDRWSNPATQGTPPSPRAAHGACIEGDTMFIFGGRSDTEPSETIRLNDLHSLDLSTLQWTRITLSGSVPIGRSWTSLTLLAPSHLILVGGLDSDSNPLNDAYVIDISTGTTTGGVTPSPHSAVLPVPLCTTATVPRLWHSAVRGFDHRVYVVGGCKNNLLAEPSQIQTRLDVYDVIQPTSLYIQCLRVAARYCLIDPALPHSILSDLMRLSVRGG